MSRSRGAVLMGAAIGLILGLGPAFAQAPDKSPLVVRAVQPGLAETKPANAVTLVFSVVNGSDKARTFAPRVVLPEGWVPVIDEAEFTLRAGEEAVRLVAVFVPVRTAVGTYRVAYEVGAADEPSLSGRAEAQVNVLLEAALAVEALEVHQLAVAGEKGRAGFIITNKSNATLDVRLDILSNGPGAGVDIRALRLEAGELRQVEVSVATDPGLPQRLDQQVQLTATAQIPERGLIGASAMSEFEVIPRVSGRGDLFNRLPIEVGLLAVGAGGAQGYGQFLVSGAGAVDRAGDHRVDFYFRGPGKPVGQDLFYPFGLRSEEYRVNYESPNLAVLAGDGCYSLTRLTETGNYGRGLDLAAVLDKWTARAYAERLLVENGDGHEAALQLGWRPDDRARFGLSYMARGGPGRPEASRIVSFQSQVEHPLFHANMEYAWDGSTLSGLRAANSALWVEGGHNSRKWLSEINIIRAGDQYHGYYQNMDYDSIEGAYSGSDRWGARASFQDQKSPAAVEPYIQPFYDRTIQAGAYYRAKRWLSLSLDGRVHDRRDLSPQAGFDYRDTTLRLGAFYYAGTLGLQSFVDLGRTVNNLTRAAERLTEYTVSANYLAAGRLSLAAYVHYRDQDASFTGDKLRGLDVNFNLGLRWGRFDLNAFYRTAVLHDLYKNPLSPGDFENPAFLLNNSDTFGLDLAYRFPFGHVLSFRVQRVANPFWDGHPAKAPIAMVEYTVPVGVPVNRKTTLSALRGRVYDSERNGQGVPGVVVRIGDMATVTGPKGDYVFNGLTPGSYVLTLDERQAGSRKVPVEKMPMTVVVEGGRRLDQAIGLTTGASLGGRVVVYGLAGPEAHPSVGAGPEPGDPAKPTGTGNEADGGTSPQLVERAPLIGASVEISGEGDVFRQTSDQDGRFLFEGLRPGTYTIKVSDDNLPEFHVFERDTVTVDLKPGAKEEVLVKVIPVVRTIQIIDRGEVRIKKRKDPGR